MLLPYPITSYASRNVDLTGGALDKVENFIISKFSNIRSYIKTYRSLKKLNEQELSVIGISKDEIFEVAKTAFKTEKLTA